MEMGGAERQLATLAAALKQRGHEPVVALFYAQGSLLGDLEAAGVRVAALDRRGRWDVAGFLRSWVRLVRREQPDVIHSYLSGANLVTALLKDIAGGVPVVWGVRMSLLDTSPYDWFQRLLYGVQPGAAQRADLIICNSEAGRVAAVASGYPAGRTVAVPNGIDTDRFQPNLGHREATRRAWGIADDAILVGLVGRVDPVKDHATFLRAAARVAACTRTVQFACIGDDPQQRRPAFQALAEELGLGDRLLWRDGQARAEEFYPALDLLVSSSNTEGFSNVVAEAMASGVPCAVTDVGDSARIVGTTGAVAPPGNADALALAMLDVLGRRGPGFSRTARERIVATFSVEALVEATLALLDGVVHATHASGRPSPAG